MTIHAMAAMVLAAATLTAAPMPRLVKEKGGFQFLVDDRPFLILGVQTGNSSGYPGELEKTWPLAKKIHVNTVEVPIQWQAVEPVEGKFDFTLVDGIVTGARKNGLRLILAWFGGFKNGAMHFAPAWVKEDVKKYPRMVDQTGSPIRALATHVDATQAADARAFAAFMRHLKEIDGEQHTVIAVQVENEAGVLGTDRDHSESANRLIAQAVPAEVVKAFGRTGRGTWSEVFGVYANETFAAYHQARYLNRVAEAGKREFPLPMFLNVWTDIQDGFYEPGFSHPSGGPTTRMLPLYKALVPSIDWISPDIYKQNYVQYVQEATPYSRPDNPLLIPETGRDLGFCRRMFYALGDLKGIGVSVFGVEGAGEEGIPESLRDLAATYRVLTEAMPLLAEAKRYGQLHSFVEEQGIATLVTDFGEYEAMAQFGPSHWGYGGARAAGTPKTTGRALIGQIGPEEFVIAGFDTTVNFRPKFGSAAPRADFVSAEEGAYVNGAWKARRQLSGDQIFFGLRLPGAGAVVKVKLMKY
ncbi:DUF5597 domain-containing protein [uncultured Paludibaculum sp.]|uniref:DUF5597 domain-containing protein n=1 Tax=uncultured Paludibaculum sp. TaxID=1765020 RepID=UPI002AAB3AF1|nr:DUF5597 domain-containing protein [uncultured Paludibaculum sp.]